jgi:hypothetical protein
MPGSRGAEAEIERRDTEGTPMRRMTPAVMAAMLILGATPLTAIAADPSAEPRDDVANAPLLDEGIVGIFEYSHDRR